MNELEELSAEYTRHREQLRVATNSETKKKMTAQKKLVVKKKMPVAPWESGGFNILYSIFYIIMKWKLTKTCITGTVYTCIFIVGGHVCCIIDCIPITYNTYTKCIDVFQLNIGCIFLEKGTSTQTDCLRGLDCYSHLCFSCYIYCISPDKGIALRYLDTVFCGHYTYCPAYMSIV